MYRAIDNGRSTSRMKWIWILGLGGVFFEAYSGAALATGLAPLTEQLQLSTTEVSIITSTYMVLAVLLCPLAGSLADRFGRIPILISAKVIACASMVIGLAAPNFEILLASRLLAGIAWAMDFGVVLAYIAEFLPRRHQRKLSRWQGVWYVATTANLLIAFLIYQMDVGLDIWRYLLGTGAIIAALLAVLQFLLLPESPRWLASKGRYVESVKALKIVYHTDAVAVEGKSAGDGPAIQAPGFIRGTRELFSPPYLGRTTLSTVTFAAQALQYYAVGWYLPIIAFRLFGESFEAATLGAAVFNAVGIAGGFAAAGCYKVLGIRRAVRIGFACCAAVLIVFGLAFDNLPLWAAIGLPTMFILFHSTLAASGGAAFSALAFPSHLRGLGMGFATTACNIGAATGLFVFPFLQETLGEGGAILATALVPLVGLAVATLIRWDPEKDLEADDTSEDLVPTPVH
ncbi:Predicted arabinose efflux permease, MFS family [Rhodococcus pyridinivorans]|nr:Predicted arabinose efflux permease, MFS family [Rhodococcus pyridinivorans]